ncbi:MAG: ACP S-malonyltransferase [Thermoleophilia bacterium]|nr:ACP S-malonyltransferase [Thermoleophilia bacterium]
MGRELAEAYPAARAVLAEASEVTGLELERLCFEGPLDELTETEVQQPALVATSLACLRAVETLGLEPDFVVGHSVGEYSALGACGALSAGDAIRLVRERGLATAAAARQHPGAMAAILGLDDDAVEELCDGIEGVWPANYNCPGQVVVSGADEAVGRLLEAAAERGARRAVRLRISGAFHSPLVGAAGPRLRPALEAASWSEPRVPFVSTVTAEIEGAGRIVELLVEQLTAPVRFTQAVARLVDEGVDTFVEIGPGQVLAGLVRRCNRDVTALSVGDRASLARLEEVMAA